MSASAPSPEDLELQLVEDLAQFTHDPLGCALYSFPWGEGELAEAQGPRDWQQGVMQDIASHLQNPETRFQPLMIAVASGHGIGKSAEIGMILHWAMSTCEDCKVVFTANTENQLRTKTGPELAKWFRLAINAHWFKPTATAIYANDPGHEKSWRADAVPWSENNTEAFAGLHNKGKRIVLVFDEASNIADKVWEVAEGALTDENTEIIWIAFGNPTRNTGRFRECFRRYKHRWITRQIDSRNVEGTNKAQIQKWIDDYGEDSDFVRIRVSGKFPKASDLQLIPSDWTTAAQRREAAFGLDDALVCGIDIARGGSDNNVIRFRRGMDAKSIKPIKIPGAETRDTTLFIAKVCTLVKDHKPDAVFVDATGVGGPVADQLRRLMPGVPVIDVNFASAAPDRHYANMRTYIWWQMREALRAGLAIDDSAELEEELTSPLYSHNQRDQVALEKKDDIKKRIGVSPDDADALALTFTFPVQRNQQAQGDNGTGMRSEYDPYGGN
ncbi:MAG: terminase [Pseudomonadota bacterium]|uniref:terminase n=1 Tax=Halopseudomonas aestusnigri TaxID=857252 RepID=UPI001D184D1A|nr:terminase [Halopseudomonas aestusnigri]MCC4260791.1 terminase [Halopseudomonas aestusnigri]MEC7472926.1 terminase [Pseudomonadota bacterium]